MVKISKKKGNTKMRLNFKYSKNKKNKKGGANYNLGEQLINAVMDKDIDLTNRLLRNGAPVDYINRDEVSSLSHAIYYNSIEFVEILLRAGANVNLKSRYIMGETPLIIASRYRNYDMVNLLLHYGADPNLTGDDNESPLHKSVIGRWEIVELLIRNGAKIDHKNKYDRTPLHKAVTYGNIDSIYTLLNLGASAINWKIKSYTEDWMILNKSNEKKYQKIIDLMNRAEKEEERKIESDKIAKYKAEQKKLNELRLAPLHYVAEIGNIRFVKEKIKAGDNINQKDEYGNTPLLLSIREGHTQISKELIKIGASLDITDKKGYTPLHIAVIKNRFEIIDILIKNSVDINAKSKEQTTPLHLAAYYGKEQIVDTLIKKGAILDLQDEYGMTPLEYAEEKGHYKVINLLANSGVYLKMIKFTTLAGDHFTLNDIIPDISLFRDNSIPANVVYSAIFSSDNEICQNITKSPFIINYPEGNPLEILYYNINQNYSIVFRPEGDAYREVLIAGKPYYACDSLGCDTNNLDLFHRNKDNGEYKYLGKKKFLIKTLKNSAEKIDCEKLDNDCYTCALSSKCKYKKYIDPKKSKKKGKKGKCVLKSHKANNENYIFNNIDQCNY